MGGDIPGAQAILAKAFEANEDSESIFLAAAKLASESGDMEAALQILEKAKAQADTDRVSVFRMVHCIWDLTGFDDRLRSSVACQDRDGLANE